MPILALAVLPVHRAESIRPVSRPLQSNEDVPTVAHRGRSDSRISRSSGSGSVSLGIHVSCPRVQSVEDVCLPQLARSVELGGRKLRRLRARLRVAKVLVVDRLHPSSAEQVHHRQPEQEVAQRRRVQDARVAQDGPCGSRSASRIAKLVHRSDRPGLCRTLRGQAMSHG